MKKSYVSVAVVLALLTLFGVGCAKKPVAKEAITLNVWESNNGPDAFIMKAGEEFTKKYPNITVKYVHVELGDAAGQIALDGPAGVGPDLFAAPHDKLGEMVAGGHVLATADPAALKQKVLGACYAALTYDGKVYGYPVSAETYGLFYNKALIKETEVPKSWTDLAAFAKKFNAANPGKYGFIMDVGNAYYTIIFTTSAGNRLFGPQGNDKSNTNINSEKSIQGMKFFQSLRASLNVPAADLTTSVADTAFSSGTAAMHITGLWNVVPFTKAGIDFGVSPLPSLPGDSTPAASFSGTRAMFVSAYSDHPEEAALFANFLLSPEMQKLRFETTGALPAINIQVDSPYMAGFIKQLDYAFPMPSIPQMGAYWEAMGNASKNIWDGADVKKELDSCNEAIISK